MKWKNLGKNVHHCHMHVVTVSFEVKTGLLSLYWIKISHHMEHALGPESKT